LNASIAKRILAIASIESVVILVGLAVLSWVLYKILFKDLIGERREIFRRHFVDLFTFGGFSIIAYSITVALNSYSNFSAGALAAAGYFGLATIILGTMAYIKLSRIYGYIYFFYSSKKAGVPVLLVNILSLILTLIFLAWLMKAIFDIHLGALVATSAILSVVLGLALQDTLGNLFAGISLQIDKPFEIDDWIELKNGTDKIGGRVIELTWRSTLLVAMTDEIINVPNRIVAQSQIMNFSTKKKPFIRSQVIRVPFDTDLEKAKSVIVTAAKATAGVADDPQPIAVITETTDSWIALKAVMSINNYGSQFLIADEFFTKALSALQANGISLASNRIRIQSEDKAEGVQLK
jgi:small-conductance mechanosensitive channel